MGNCQAVDAAAMVIQHPNGKIERLYWPIPVSEVMKNNPGHYVSLIIPLQVTDDESSRKESSEKDQGVPTEKKTVRYTRVKLLRPTDTLVLGHAYRLLTSQEVMKVLRAKKHAKMKKSEQESAERLHLNSDKQNAGDEHDISETSKTGLEAKEERQRARPAGNTAAGVGKSKSWRPALQSISEAGS